MKRPILTQQSYVLNGVTRTGGFTFDYGLGYSTGKREEPFDNEVAFTKSNWTAICSAMIFPAASPAESERGRYRRHRQPERL
jgi:hypothetical protein